jgi:hypothetical protein
MSEWDSSPPTDADLQKYRSQGTRLLVEVSYYLGPFVARVCAFSPNREVVALLPDCDYAKAIWVKAAELSVLDVIGDGFCDPAPMLPWMKQLLNEIE